MNKIDKKLLLLYVILMGFFMVLLGTFLVDSQKKHLNTKTKKSILDKIPLIATLNSDLEVNAMDMPTTDFQMLISDNKIDQNTSITPQWRYLAYYNTWLIKTSFFQKKSDEAGYTYTYMYSLNKKLDVLDKILVHSKYDGNIKLNSSYTEYQKTYVKNGHIIVEFKDVTTTDKKYEYIRQYELTKKGKFEKIS